MCLYCLLFSQHWLILQVMQMFQKKKEFQFVTWQLKIERNLILAFVLAFFKKDVVSGLLQITSDVLSCSIHEMVAPFIYNIQIEWGNRIHFKHFESFFR